MPARPQRMKKLSLLLTFLTVLVSVQSANAEWVKRNTNSFAWFKHISFLDNERGWISGTDGVLLSTVDGGQSWVQAKKFTTDAILQVHFVDENNGWMLCERSVFDKNTRSASYLRRTTDGGRTWEKLEFEEGGRERVVSLLFAPNGRAMAFGEGGVIYVLQEDKLSWKRTQTPMHYLMLDGAYATEQVGAIVGAGGTIMFTEDSGFTWEKASLIGDRDMRFSSVSFAGDKGAWAVGTKGRIYRSNGGGRLWRQQVSGVTANLTDVWFTSATSGWAIGENGVIVRTRDGGNNWTDVPSRTTHRLEKIVFNNGRGWIVGFGGTVLTYDEGPSTSDPNAKPVLMRRG
jgi:photosystem II stability/assembly factor-like uncharacterized protein